MNKIEQFKEIMKQGMIENYKRDGFLTPVLFFYRENAPLVSIIRPILLESSQGKEALSNHIKNMCLKPDVLAGGIIIEAYGAKVDVDGEIAQQLMNGTIRVSEIESKMDFILMIFSTVEKEEVFTFSVDSKNRSVTEFIEPDDGEPIGGRFSGFFNWGLN